MEKKKKELRELAKKALTEVKAIKRGLMLEFYAKERQEYEKLINGKTETLFSHWCLIRYCTITGRTQTKDHWKGEVIGYLTELAKEKIKPKNNRKIVEKMAINLWSVYATDSDAVVKLIINKFKKEGIELRIENMLPCVHDLQKNIPTMVELIAYGTIHDIIKYVNSI